MRKTIILLLAVLCLAGSLSTAEAAFTEPLMADYSAFPVFMTQSVPPNIMIILDNSGSMNFNAYGTYPGDYGTVSDAPFTGEPYSGMKSFQVTSAQDDAEEGTAIGSVLYYNNADLDLGGFSVASNDALVGIRFQNVAIPQGAVIQSAYLEFRANTSNSEISNFLIEGEASDNAAPYSLAADNLKNRTPTAATVTWENVQAWTAGEAYPSPDITAIVQEIVNRGGWTSGNSMAFRFSGAETTDNKRDIRSYDANSGTAPILHVVFDGDPAATRYYGYFNPDYFYSYSSNVFTLAYKKIGYSFGSSSWSVENLSGGATTLSDAAIVNNGLWDGNWLNWLCMRRIDVLRKVLMGGLATARTGGGNQVNYGETPAQTSRVFYKQFNSSIASAVSPYDGNYSYRMSGGRIRVNGVDYNIRIQKDENHEPTEFIGGNLSGILQRVGSGARWGNIWFNDGSGSGQSGGTVEHTIGTNLTSLITDLQNTGCDTWTPLAETFYVAMQYFKQENPAGGLDYPNNAVPNSNLGDDPYYNGTEFVYCAKSYVILLTDGASTKDEKVPSTYKDYDGDGDNTGCNESAETNCDYPSGGTDFLDDLALYAHTVDLRADLEKEQVIKLYAVYAFGDDDNARSLLQDAARNGGFKDQNHNNLPDLDEEWDHDNDGVPDTFFEASDGYALEAKLIKAINEIKDDAASGTSASVLATNSEGEGNMLQAYFIPTKRSVDEADEANWLGFLQSLWVDSNGNLYEDDANPSAHQFDQNNDTKITYVVNSDGHTQFTRGDSPDVYELSDLHPIFEANKLLSERDLGARPRTIFTYIDSDKDGEVDDASGGYFAVNSGTDASGEVISFGAATAAQLKPYFGVRDDLVWGDSGANLGSSIDNRARNIAAWVGGTDVPGLRNRTLDGVTYRLGDIVDSTPVSISAPPEKFHIWYSDDSYKTYYDLFKDRESVVYVGGNDGLLHAFTTWRFDKDAKQYVDPDPGSNMQLGDELWAFIPQSVLPHLKWVAHEDYTHTYLVDAKPSIFDAKIIPSGTHYSGGSGDQWGTILVMGLNMGAKQIGVNEDFGSGLEERTFYPSYVCLDITDPRKPGLLWERTYPNQAMSRSTPVPVKVGDRWFLVFGSGPTAYDGSSNQKGYIFIVDMKTGALLRQLGPYEDNAFFATAASLDKNLNYNVDAIYIGETYFASNKWQGSLYKIAVPCSNCQWNASYDPGASMGYSSDPAAWYAHKLFQSDRPITAPPSISVELYPDLDVDNVWVYFGTGRFIAEPDKSSSDQEYVYGIKDPLFNVMYKGSSLHDYGASQITLDRADLFQSDDVTVTTAGHVLKGGTIFGSGGAFADLVTEIRDNHDGWYRALETSGIGPSERMISKPSVFAGITFFPVYTPDPEICKFGGTTNLYALYYLTGTGYFKQIFDLDASQKTYVTVSVGGQTSSEEVVAVKLPQSMIGSPPPSIGIHSGSEKGAKAYMQQSTGQVVEINTDVILYNKSTITDWWDRVDVPQP